MNCKKNHTCRGNHNKTEKFLEVCLLMLLVDNTSHGYSLMSDLEEFGYKKEDISVSTLYRNLRKMEKENLVISSWKKGEGGPKKRVYTISDKGRDELSSWINFLKQRKKYIEKLINKYNEKTNN